MRYRRSSLPGIVTPEAPDVTLQIAARVSPPAVVLILHIAEHHRAGGLRARAVRIAVTDDDVSALGLAAADFFGELHQLPEHPAASRRHHDHSIAKSKLRVRDGAVLTRNDEMLLEPEGFA